jgi:hypothetical protein
VRSDPVVRLAGALAGQVVARWVGQADRDAFACLGDRQCQIAAVADDHDRLDTLLEHIHEHVRCDVDVRALSLAPSDADHEVCVGDVGAALLDHHRPARMRQHRLAVSARHGQRRCRGAGDVLAHRQLVGGT